jgi:hypothetical protein
VIEPLATLSCKCRRIALAMVIALSGLIVLAPPPAVAAGAHSAGRTSYVFLVQGSRSSTMSGSTEDLRRAKALRVDLEGLLYIRNAEGAYLIRDSAILRRAEAIFQPQQVLGARQGELGRRQAALGTRQGALGIEQGRLGRQQADASPRRSQELARQQEALGRQQNALGEQQDALARQQAALGREQERLAREADAKIRALLAEALQRGAAPRGN